MKKTSHLFRGAASIFLALLIIVQIVGTVANNWAGRVNELLGISASTIERSSDPADYTFLSDFENPSALIDAEIALNTRLAAEGSVVLKGDPALGGTKVTLFGMRSGGKMQFGGSMGELTDASNVVTLAQAMEANGFSVNPSMVQFYKDMEASYAPTRGSGGNVVNDYAGQGAAIGEVPVSEYNAADIGDYKDAAVVVFGRDAGESSCFYPGLNGLADPSEFTNSPTGNILSLSNDERDLLNWVKGQGFSKIVVLLNSGAAMEIEELKTDGAVSSIIWIGNPGAYGTYGVAKLLSGEVLPSGHLPDTFAVNSAKSPAAQNYGIYTFANAADIETTNNNGLRSSWYLVEAEGIYTGYKYYETRYFDSVLGQGNASTASHGETANGGSVWNYDNEVSYSFGYGVEGSTFSEEITNVNIDWSGATDSTVTVKVTNTGSAAAKHAVQLYVSVPYTDSDKRNGVEKSAIQLVGYAKTGEAQEQTFADVVLLAPGDSEEVTVTFNAQDIYSYDMTYQHDGVAGAWVLAAGDYYFATGNGAHDAVQAVLKAMGHDVQSTGTVRVEKLAAEMTVTESNGVTVQNRLEEGDLNHWNTDAKVTWLTRNDWAGTFPQSISTVTATADMIGYLRNAFYDAAEALAGYDGPTEFTYGADNGVKAVDLIGLDYDDPKYDELLDEMELQDLVNQYLNYLEEIGYIALPKENPADSPLGIIGTIGQRSKGSIYEVSEDDPAYGYHTNAYVGAPVVAATFSPFLQAEEGRLIANDALWSGYTTWYGPGLNLHRTPYNGRNVAYYSEDAVLTGLTAVYVHRTLWEYGIVTNTKHFAFNDQETNRDGLAVFLTEQAAREGELRGFQIPIREGSLKGLMSAFNRIGLTHVAAHTGLMNGILRGEWGWNGYMMTDAVKSAQYFLPRETLLAGNDQMLGGSNNGAVWNFTADSVKDDPVVQAGIRESFHRKLFVYVNSILLNGMTQDSKAGGGQVWWVTMFQVLGALTLIGFLAFFILFLWRAWKEKEHHGSALELTSGVAALILMIAAVILYALNFTTNYYIFGEMQSIPVAVLLGAAIAVEIVALVARAKLPEEFWPKLLTFVVTGALAAATALLLGDRVEGIGNCIVTDYDSGHGGEEAIYMSLAACVLMLVSIVYNVIGSFSGGKAAEKTSEEAPSKNRAIARTAGFGVSALAVLLAVLIPTYMLVNPAGGVSGPGTTGSGGTYTVSYNQGNGNADTMPTYQFLCSNFKGMIQADSRFYIDVTLTLDGEGGYTLFSDAYVIEAGKRAVVGDDTGLGLVLTMNAEGSYTENADGTVTTSVPAKAVFEMQTDTYSAQMKEAANMNVGGNSEDGVYDSNDEPAVLDFVPETIWTLSGGSIVSYRDANAGGSYSVSFNQGNGNADGMPNYQFLCSDLSGMVQADSRFYIDVALTLDGSNYTLSVDSYVIEAGKRAEVGDDTGLGLVLTMNAVGSYTENADGTVTTGIPTHAVFEMQTDTYSAQMKEAANMNVNGSSEDGVYDSNDEPAVLDFVPETVWTLSGSDIVTWANAAGGGEEPSGEGLTVTSEDGATTFTFYADGTYRFYFPDYDVEDLGTYTYDGTTLTITDKNGAVTTAEGDPLTFHYLYSDSDALTGDFTVSAADLAALLGGGKPAGEGLTVTSEDGATTFTFYADGTYYFLFAAYNVEDRGEFTYDGSILTITNANGDVVTAEGDPLTFHYVTAISDQVAGDFTVSAADLAALLSGGAASVTFTSDDGATAMTFYDDGTYVFAFEAYGVEDPGTYTYENGILTVTNAAGAEMTAEGDPLKLHYVSGVSDQLTGDFTIPAADMAAMASLTVASEDGATTFTFRANGTYRFFFAAYEVEDLGTYTYDGTSLVITDKNGAETTVTGDPLKLHYAFSDSDQLTGDFTVSAADLAAVAPLTVASEDGATTFTFYAGGSYRFFFAAYGVEDLGTYAFDGTTLTVTDKNGAVTTVTGDPLKLHYAFSDSDQLTGDFTVPAAALR